MALNDWSDRDLDAVERPERPIPSGRVTPRTALTLASSLTATGLALSALSGGRPALRTSAALAATAWTYDLAAKNTPAGPFVMAAARFLDVLVGAGTNRRAALAPALAIGTHILGTTLISRGEVHGSTPTSSRAALTATTLITTTTAASGLRNALTTTAGGGLRNALTTTAGSGLRNALTPATAGGGLRNALATPRSSTPATYGAASTTPRLSGAGGGVLAAVFAGLYARSVGRAQLVAAGDPTADNLRRAVGAGIHGLVPLQAAWCARGGAPLVGAGLMAALPLAKALARKISPT
jgi:4-hydroxybenzoate polyprenyltransferase